MPDVLPLYIDLAVVKEISKALRTYIRDVCGQTLPERASDIANLKAIAEKASEVDTIQVCFRGGSVMESLTLTLSVAPETCPLRSHLLPKKQ
jgi:hypothetical protein